MDARKVWVGQRGEQLHLAIIRVGSFDDFFRVERVQVDLLDGNAPVPVIPRLVDDTKAALTDFLLNMVALSQHGTGSQRSAGMCRNRSRSHRSLYCWR